MDVDKASALEWIKQSRITGMALAALSGFAFTVSNFLVQMSIHTYPSTKIPTLQFVFIRSAIQTIVGVPLMLLLRIKINCNKNQILSHVLMGLTGYFNIVLIYYALDRIPIADALAITFTGPIF